VDVNEYLQKVCTLNVVTGNFVIITMGHSNGVTVLFARIFAAINTEMECNVQLEARLVLNRNTGSVSLRSDFDGFAEYCSGSRLNENELLGAQNE
jgi:hypothetical protein